MNPSETTPRLLIAAGPTYEPIDSVRFIGNRSSGKLGIALAAVASERGWSVTLLLGPNTHRPPAHAKIDLFDFESTSELQQLLQTHLPQSDTLIMAAAVADYRVSEDIRQTDKLPRSAEGWTLRLEPTPDLLAGCSAMARTDQLLVGFALEPRDRMLASARTKLTRKNIDLIVANPLETMDSDKIEATLLANAERGIVFDQPRQVHTTKPEFADWLLDEITPLMRSRIAGFHADLHTQDPESPSDDRPTAPR
ncbi:MAG: phosphopantothenoylcysteine decarboxylase domain-containing protein [Phycisphaerales bacterium]